MNRRFIINCIAVLFLVGKAAVIARAADDDPKTTYLNSEAAGLPFAIQGEYAGQIQANDGDIRLGIQVISLGQNKLSWVVSLGGLPGDGWDGSEQIRGDGEIRGTKGILTGEAGRAEIQDGSLKAYNNDNLLLGELPRVVRVSPTIGRKPPEGAVVLFDGTTAEHFEGGRLTDDGLLMQGVTSKAKFQSCELHLEFQLSFMPNARGQARSNSGCYLQGRYEVQMLDSFGLTGEQNECGGIYSIRRPDVNMCFPPLSWQTYDIEYHAAEFDDEGKKRTDARMTVRHNGVVIHNKVKLPHSTTAAPVPEGPDPGPLHLQNHGDEVRYRNIWYRPL